MIMWTIVAILLIIVLGIPVLEYLFLGALWFCSLFLGSGAPKAIPHAQRVAGSPSNK
jgi:hypothetical protein